MVEVRIWWPFSSAEDHFASDRHTLVTYLWFIGAALQVTLELALSAAFCLSLG